MREAIIQAISTGSKSTGEQSDNGTIGHESVSDQINNDLTRLTDALEVIPSQFLVLNRLWFPSITRRESLVDTEHEGTFRWLLYESPSTEPHNLNSMTLENPSLKLHQIEEFRREAQTRELRNKAFSDWLRSGHGVFHISGKAGSGKSTLMKFLTREDKTRQILEQWAGEIGRKLVLGCFFFWSSGEELQRSLEGLYRAILWDVLSQRPDLIARVFPDTSSSRRAQKMIPDSLGAQTPFERDELHSALDRLFGFYQDNSDYPQLCLFIDGLDEYKEDCTDYWKLSKSLLEWSSTGNVKFCVSSRPYNEFMALFSTDPTRHFQLHNLTRLDMYCYVSSEFSTDGRVQSSDISHHEAMDLVSEIVDKADGIFLWTRLVTNQLLKAIGNHCSSKQLREKLGRLPQGLGALFRQMMEAIDDSERTRAAQTLLILKSDWRRHFNHQQTKDGLYIHWILDEMADDASMAQSIVTGTFAPRWSYENWLSTCQQPVAKRIVARCQGLVEISYEGLASGWLTFIHRSVADFLDEEEAQTSLRKEAGCFHPERVLIRAMLAWIKFQNWNMDRIPSGHELSNLVYTVLGFNSTWYDLENVTDHRASAQNIDCLVRMCIQVAASFETGRVDLITASWPLRYYLRPPWIPGMSLVSVDSLNVDAFITCSALTDGSSEIALERVRRDPSLIAPGAFGSNMILEAALLTRRSNEVHILQTFIDLKGSDINASCAISYRRGIRKQGGPHSPDANTSIRLYLRTPPWTVWTTYLFITSLNWMYLGERPEEDTVTDDWEAKVIRTFLENEADPTVCFVGYKTDDEESPPWDEEVDLCFVTLRDMMACWGLTMTPELVQLLEGPSQTSIRNYLKWPYGFYAQAMKSPKSATIPRYRGLSEGDLFRTLKIVSLEQLPDLSLEELKSMRKIMLDPDSEFMVLP